MKYILWVGLSGLMLLFSCSDPSTIGVDFLDDDELELGAVDTFTITGFSQFEDSVLTWDPTTRTLLSTLLTGRIRDLYFGSTEVDLYTEFSNSFVDPDLKGTADSLILMLVYDTLGFYGDTSSPISMDVLRLEEDIKETSRSYSNNSFATGELLGGAYNIKANPYQRITVIEPGNDTITYPPHLRITLSLDLAKEIIALDTSGSLTSKEIKEFVRGFKFSTPFQSESNALLGFDMDNDSTVVRLYYTQDTTKRYYDFIFSASFNKRFTHIAHDRTGSPVEDYLQNHADNDSLLFFQSLGGLASKVNFPTIKNLRNVAINRANLEFFVLEANDDPFKFYPPIKQLVTFHESNGGLILVQDVYRNASNVKILDKSSGGVVIKDVNGMKKYRINLSSHIQDILRGSAPTEIYITSYLRGEFPGRSIIFGPGHSQYPMKLYVTYTKL